MASEVDSTVLLNSAQSIETSSTQLWKKKSSNIHQYCRDPSNTEAVRDDRGRKIYYCSLCTSHSSKSTTNLRKHLFRDHDIKLEPSIPNIKATALKQLQDLWSQATANDEAGEFDSLILKSIINKEVLNQALINLIVVRNLPFRIVEWPEFHAYCQALNPEAASFITTSHSVVSDTITQLFQLQKDIVRKKVQSAITNIHLSVDIWTSPNNHLLLAICAHFVNSNEQRVKALLALRTVASHSGEEQWNTLLPVLQDYGILRKLGALIADNSTTNDVLSRTISQYLLREENIKWDPQYQRIRCQGHVINLIVQAFLFNSTQLDQIESNDNDTERELNEKEKRENKEVFRAMGALGKLHNIIVHSRSSAGRTKEFTSLAQRMIPLDNSTRWNSWFHMLSTSLMHEGSIDKYVKSNFKTLEKDYLSPQDWRTLRTINAFLQPFHRATLVSQGDNATLDRQLFTMDILGKHMENSLAQNRTNKDMTSRIQQAIKKSEEYYRKTDCSPLYVAALILHPNRRTKYAKVWWKKDFQRAILPKVKELWTTYRDSAPPIVPYETPAITEPQELDEFDRLEIEFNERTTRPSSQDEYEDYCTEAPYEIQVRPIEWWAHSTQRRRWPRLSAFAMEILSIPAMSDEPERVFSGGRRTISWERAKIGELSVERTECMKSWFRSGILDDEKIEIASNAD
jgi:hypothetical protein